MHHKLHTFYEGEKVYSLVYKQNMIIDTITKGFSTTTNSEVEVFYCTCIHNSKQIVAYRGEIMSMFEHDTIFGLISKTGV